jgi:adenylate cyclase
MGDHPFTLWSLGPTQNCTGNSTHRNRAADDDINPHDNMMVKDFSRKFVNDPAIAVLPFTCFGATLDHQYLCSALADDVINELSSWRLFPVIARNSSFIFRDTSYDIRELGLQLCAKYIVEGSITQVGEAFRILARVIDTDTAFEISSGRFNCHVKELPVAYDQVTQMIVGSLAPEIIRAERKRVYQIPEYNLTAYLHFIKGLDLHYRYSRNYYAQAQKEFRKAIDEDPANPRAYALLAHSIIHAVQQGWREDEGTTIG